MNEVSSHHDLKMLEKMHSVDQKRNLHLAKVRECCGEWQRRRELIYIRKTMTHVRPLCHGISLLHELPTTPDVVLQPPTGGGVAFTVESGYYQLNSTQPLKIKKVYCVLDEDEERKEVS